MPATKTRISPLAVRRSLWINATPERIWKEFESLERMQAWYGTGHSLAAYEPKLGGYVETRGGNEGHGEDPLRFGGRIIVFDPPNELTYESDWFGHGWKEPSLITFRLTAFQGGTVVELFHHRFEGCGEGPALLNGFEGGWDTHHLVTLRDIVEA